MSIGYVCDPEDSLTLILSKFWTPIGITSAREGIRKLCRDASNKRTQSRVFAIDNHSNIKNWSQWEKSSPGELFSNQPFLRTNVSKFPVPTILLTTSKWTYNCKVKPTVKYMYRRYNGICQICGESKKMMDMSIEHILPKSLHGTNDDFNLTLTCKSCNNSRGNIYPYHGVGGQILKPMKQIPYLHVFKHYRDEWETFFVKKI